MAALDCFVEASSFSEADGWNALPRDYGTTRPRSTCFVIFLSRD